MTNSLLLLDDKKKKNFQTVLKFLNISEDWRKSKKGKQNFEKERKFDEIINNFFLINSSVYLNKFIC